MKVIIPNFAAVDSFVDNVASTLRAMGHEVKTPELGRISTPQSPIAAVVHDIRRKAFPQLWTRAEQWLVTACRESAPDLVLCLTQPLKDEVLAAVRQAGVRHLVAWWGDPPGNMREMGLLSDGWDHIYIKDAAAVAKFRTVGLPAELLHEAMNPLWHTPVGGPTNNQVAVAGNFYGYRQFLVRRLIEQGVELGLYGAKLPRWVSPEISAMHTGTYITRQDKSRVFGQSLACLNCSTLAEGDSLNCRAFEIAGAGGLQLIEDKPSVSECFEPGREVLVYRSVEDILDYLARARAEPDWAQNIRQAAARRAHDEHTYERRLRLIIGRLEG
jgi:spore maturation protein CgeB